MPFDPKPGVTKSKASKYAPLLPILTSVVMLGVLKIDEHFFPHTIIAVYLTLTPVASIGAYVFVRLITGNHQVAVITFLITLITIPMILYFLSAA
jgi:hypothetical protein